MATAATGEITRLLEAIRAGDGQAQSRLVALVYDQLYAIARRATAGQARRDTLNPTALINQAFVKLIDTNWLIAASDRGYFFAVAAKAMRHILADHARQRSTQKRGGGWTRIALDQVVDYLHQHDIDTLTLTDALDELERRDPRKAQVVQLRFFGGFTIHEIGEHLGVSYDAVELDWRAARAFLKIKLC